MTLILSGTDGLSDIDGSASTPAIRGTDANTGIYFPAADQVAVSLNGASSMLFTGSGATLETSSVPLTINSTNSNAYKVALEDNGTDRGFLGANSSNALMVADGAAANVLNVTAAGVLQTNSGYGSVAPAYGVRAWVNFNGISTISRSGGVSSVTNTGTGTYVVNFSFTMPDVFYAPVFFSDANSSIIITQPINATTTSVSFTARNGAGTFFNGNYAGCVVVR